MLSSLGMESGDIPSKEKQSQEGIALVLCVCISQIPKSPLPCNIRFYMHLICRY